VGRGLCLILCLLLFVFNMILKISYKPRYTSENPEQFGGTYILHAKRGGAWRQVGHIDAEFVHEDKRYYNGLVPRKTIRIIYIVIDDDFRGMGYGRKLVEYVESEGRRYGMKRSYANNVMQQSVGFWRRMGYEELIRERRIWIKKLR